MSRLVVVTVAGRTRLTVASRVPSIVRRSAGPVRVACWRCWLRDRFRARVGGAALRALIWSASPGDDRLAAELAGGFPRVVP